MANLGTSPEPELRMSREEYRRWAEAQPSGRFERIEGWLLRWRRSGQAIMTRSNSSGWRCGRESRPQDYRATCMAMG